MNAIFLLLIWISILIGLAAATLNLPALINADLSRQSLDKVMIDFQRSHRKDPEVLEKIAQRFPTDVPFKYALSAYKADALVTMKHFNDDAKTWDQDITESYQNALIIRPQDGYLWAKFARFLGGQSGSSNKNQFLKAMENAFNYGKYDYNTIRQLAETGMRNWPVLNCNLKSNVLSLLQRSKEIDDSMLSQWNTSMGRRILSEDVDRWAKTYQFNLRWAKINIESCHDV